MQALPHVHQLADKSKAHLRLGGRRHRIHVMHSVCETGPKLIEMDRKTGSTHAGKDVPGPYRIFHVRDYHTAAVRLHNLQPQEDTHAGISSSDLKQLSFTVTDSSSGAPIAGAKVVAYFDFATKKGAPPATTDNSGRAQVVWLKSLSKIPQLWIFPPELPTYWGISRLNIDVESEFKFAMEPVDPAYTDCVRALFPNRSFDSQSGVVVGVVDTGVDQHTGLNLIGGQNTVKGEDPKDYGSNGDPHGTHVAGLVGAHGTISGSAPGVQLRARRAAPRLSRFRSGRTECDEFCHYKGNLFRRKRGLRHFELESRRGPK